MPVTNPAKSLLALALEWYPFVNVVVASGKGKVKLPESIKGNVLLRIEPNNPQNNQGFAMEREGFRCTMSFNRAPHSVFVPWNAIINIATDEYAIVFPEEVEAPPDLHDPIKKPVKLRGIDGGKAGE